MKPEYIYKFVWAAVLGFCLSTAYAQETKTYTVDVTVNNDLWGNVSKGGVYTPGTVITLQAVSRNDILYEFVGWRVNGGGMRYDNPLYYRVENHDDIIEAEFKQKTYSLKVKAEPREAAAYLTPDSNYVGDSYPEITLEARPRKGWIFDYWEVIEDADSRSDDEFIYKNPYRYRTGYMRFTRNITFVAHFIENLSVFNVGVEPVEGGTLDFEYSNMERVGRKIPLRVAPAEGFRFGCWLHRQTTDQDWDTLRHTNGTPYRNGDEFEIPVENEVLKAVMAHNLYTVEVSSYPAGWATVSGAGTYFYGDRVLLSAVETDSEYSLDYWARKGHESEVISRDNPFETEITEDVDYVAVMRVRPRRVRAVCIPEGAASFTGTGNYEEGNIAIVAAKDSYGYRFLNWVNKDTNVISVGNPYRIRVDHDTTVYGLFEPNDFNVLVMSDGALTVGEVSVNNGEYSLTHELSVPYNEEIILKAQPAASSGYLFWRWRVCVEDPVTGEEYIDSVYSHHDSIVFKVTGNITLKATFVEEGCVVKGGVLLEGGPLAQELEELKNTDPDEIPLEKYYGRLRNTGNYRKDNWISLNAEPKPGFAFSRWIRQDGSEYRGGSNELLLLVEKDTAVYALFKPDTLSAELSIAGADVGGKITGGGRFGYDSVVRFVAKTAYGYDFKGWYAVKDDGRRVWLSDTQDYSFRIRENLSVEALFERSEFEISAGYDIINRNYLTVGTEPGEIRGTGSYVYRDEALLEAVAFEGFKFYCWHNGTDSVYTRSIRVRADSNCHFTAVFTPEDCQWKVTSANPLMGRIKMSATRGALPAGSVLRIEAEPYPHYRFVQWQDKDGNRLVSADADSTTMEILLTGNTDIYALFDGERYNVRVGSAQPERGLARHENASDGRISYMNPVTVVAIPSLGFEFDHWEDIYGNELESHSATLYVNVVSDTILQAYFRSSTYQVSLGVEPFGAGKAEFYRITCGDTLELPGSGAELQYGDTVYLKSEPGEHYLFFGWRRGVETYNAGTGFGALRPGMYANERDPEFTETVDRTEDVIAVFVPKSYPVCYKIEPDGAGSVKIRDDETECNYGESVELIASPAAAMRFVGWRNLAGQWLSSAPRYDYYASGTDTVTAVFETDSVDVSLSTAWGGEVSGGGRFLQGRLVTVKAAALGGYQFVEWRNEEGNTLSDHNPYTFTARKNINITAVFEPIQLPIIATASKGGKVNGTLWAAYGSSMSAVAVADSGYSFDEWHVERHGMEPKKLKHPYISMDVTDTLRIAAYFSTNRYFIEAEPSPAQWGSVKHIDGLYNYGTAVNITAQPAEGYVFSYWTLNGKQLPEKSNRLRVSVKENARYVAVFQPKKVNLLVKAEPADSALTFGGGEYFYGDSAHIAVVPLRGNAFTGWSSTVPEYDEYKKSSFSAPLFGNEVFIASLIYTGFTDSANKIAVPVFYPSGGTLSPGQRVKISCATPGAEIYYTEEENVFPCIKYEEEIEVNGSAYITAVAIRGEDTSSLVSSVFYSSEGTGGNSFVYPNPIEWDGVMNVKLDAPDLLYVRLYSLDGAVVFHREVSQTGIYGTSLVLPKNLSGVFVYELGLKRDVLLREKIVVPARP